MFPINNEGTAFSIVVPQDHPLRGQGPGPFSAQSIAMTLFVREQQTVSASGKIEDEVVGRTGTSSGDFNKDPFVGRFALAIYRDKNR